MKTKLLLGLCILVAISSAGINYYQYVRADKLNLQVVQLKKDREKASSSSKEFEFRFNTLKDSFNAVTDKVAGEHALEVRSEVDKECGPDPVGGTTSFNDMTAYYQTEPGKKYAACMQTAKSNFIAGWAGIGN